MRALLANLLSDVFNDPDVSGLPVQIGRESMPSYTKGTTTSAAPISAGVIGSGDSVESGGQVATLVTPQQPLRREDILHSREFQHAVESVLEGTLFNLMQEASAGEFKLDKFPILVLAKGRD